MIAMEMKMRTKIEEIAISGSKLDGDRDRKVPLLICQSIFVIVIVIGVPHSCGMDVHGMNIMQQMSDIATIQDIYGMLIFEDEHAIDV